MAVHKEDIGEVTTGEHPTRMALRELDVRLRLTEEVVHDGLFYWDIVKNTVEWTENLLTMLGVTRAAWGGGLDDFFLRVHPDDQALVGNKIKAHFERGEPYDYELRLRHSAGDYRVFDVHGVSQRDESGAPVRMVGCLRDITERKLAERTLKEQLDINQKQKDAIVALSTPIIEVWEGVLTMPVLGVIDGQRAAQMMEVLLDAVTRTRCRNAIIDLTGVEEVDTATASHLIKIIQAIQLLGARGIIVGIRPELAQAFVTIGANLSSIITLANLREALLMCMRT
ncbi:MAG: PAS domain-containing protein [Byssovorax sp.]